MHIINHRLTINRRLKVSVPPQEVGQRLFGNRNLAGIVWIFIRQVRDLEKSRIGKQFHRSGELDDTKVVSRFKDERNSQAANLGSYAHLYFWKITRLLQSLARRLDRLL